MVTWKTGVWISVVTSLVFSGVAAAQTTSGTTGAAPSSPTPSLRTGTWSGGGGIGFLADTPDRTAFAVNFNADRFISEHVSLGPLVQLAFTDVLAQYGFSGQAKYWIDLGEAPSRTRLYLQGGIGIVHADFRADDTSWLIPLGAGIDYALSSGVRLTAAFLLNFTDLDTGGGTGADVMPGVAFGVQF